MFGLKSLFTFSLITISFCLPAQNKIEVEKDTRTKSFYKDLDKNIQRFEVVDIRNNSENSARIWYPSKIQYIKNNELHITQVYQELDSKKDYIFKIQVEIDSTPNLTIADLKNIEPSYPLDCPSATIEIVEDGIYYVKSVGCNNEITKVTSKLNKNIIYHSEVSNFVHQLPSGNYIFGTSRKFINKPLNNSQSKSELYKQVESKLANVGIFPSEDVFKQPSILLDGKQISYDQLNTIPNDIVKNITIIPNDPRGAFQGGVSINTK